MIRCLAGWLIRAEHRRRYLPIAPMPSWLQMAAEVRSKSSEFDVIVLHVHPTTRCRTCLLRSAKAGNILQPRGSCLHAGMDVAGIVADIRKAGHDLSSSLRAARPTKSCFPSRLPMAEILNSKAEARRKLGLPTNAPLPSRLATSSGSSQVWD